MAMRKANISLSDARQKAAQIGQDLFTETELAEVLMENLRGRQQEIALYLTNIDNYEYAASKQPEGSDLRAEYEARIQGELGQLERSLTIAEALKEKIDNLPDDVKNAARSSVEQIVLAQKEERVKMLNLDK